MSQQQGQKQIIRNKRESIRNNLKCSLNAKIQIVQSITEQGKKNSISIPLHRNTRKRQYSFDSTNDDASTPLINTIIYEDFDELYEIHEKLGQGTESIVYRCTEKKTSKQYAVKVMKIADTQKIESFKCQYNILRSLHHKNIISLRSLFINEVNNKCYMLSQYISYKSLRQVIENPKNSLKMNEKINLLSSLLDAVNYMHSNNICHRDLKPENIMYNQMTDQIKIIDFEIAKFKKDWDDDNFMWTNTGTLHYKAPQMFKGGYSQQIDIWAIGIIAYELFVGKLPFKSNYQKDFIKMINEDQPYFPENILQKKSINFIKQCLQKDPKQRITAQNALFHKLFEKCEETCYSPFKKATHFFDEQKKQSSQISIFQQFQKEFCSNFEKFEYDISQF